MHIAVLQEELNKALSLATRFISSRLQLPILANVLLSARANKLYISSTNLETSASVSIGAKVTEPGEIAVPGKACAELVTNLNKGTVDLSCDKEILIIAGDGFKSSISGINSSDFPDVPSVLAKESSPLPSGFTKALSKVVFSVSIDETRPSLTGVLMTAEGKGLFLVSTDGFRLSKKKIALSEKLDFDKVLVPRTILSEVGRGGESEEIKFSYNKSDGQVLFAQGKVVLTSRTIAGEFPDFEKIIPKNSGTKVSVDKEELGRAVKLASVFARTEASVVKLNVDKKGLEVSAQSASLGEEKTKIDAKVAGEAVEIAFNYHFIEEFLAVVEGETAEMEFVNATSPGKFLDPKDSDYLHLIMPVKLQS